MKKIIKQDGDRKVFILEDGKEIPFDKINTDEKEDKKDNKDE